ncbi:MAG: hypothetical protein ACYDGN_17325, partial [Acidimicrobiales bacterium]
MTVCGPHELLGSEPALPWAQIAGMRDRLAHPATKMRRSAPAFMPGVKRRRRYVGRVWDSMYWRRTESGAPPAD